MSAYKCIQATSCYLAATELSNKAEQLGVIGANSRSQYGAQQSKLQHSLHFAQQCEYKRYREARCSIAYSRPVTKSWVGGGVGAIYHLPRTLVGNPITMERNFTYAISPSFCSSPVC